MKSKFLEGSFAVLLQIVGQKSVIFLNQLVIARYLSQEDFGTYALLISVTNLTFFFGLFGLSDIAVNRSKSLHLWYDNLRNMYVFLGCFSSVLTALSACILYCFNQDAELLKLLLLYALGAVVFSLNVFYEVILRINKKFKQLSLVKFSEVLLTQALIVLLVIGGMKIYSFVVALSLIPTIKFFYFLKYFESRPFRFSLKVRWFKVLLFRSGFATGYSIVSRFSYQVDYFVVAFLLSREDLGLYFMSYTLAVQSFAMLVASLPTVSFPMFAGLRNDLVKLRLKFFEITLLLVLVGSAVVAVQWLALPHAIELFLPPKWHNTTGVVELLTCAMFFRITSSQWPIILKIQSKYRELFWTSLCWTIAMFGFLIIGVKIGGLKGMINSLLCFYILLTFYQTRLIGVYNYFSMRFLKTLIIALIIFTFCYVGDCLYLWDSWQFALLGIFMISVSIFLVGKRYLHGAGL